MTDFERRKKCECGCGEYTKKGRGNKYNRFLPNHHHRCRSEETKKLFSEVRKGKDVRTKEHKQKMNEVRKMMVGENAPNFGHRHSEETKQRMSESRTGLTRSEEYKNNLSKAMKKAWQDPENRESWSEGKFKGGGKYGIKNQKERREQIRIRDNYICQYKYCGKQQTDQKLDVHHIDYDKKNWDERNLISLCSSCHRKTNFNRLMWEDFYTNVINDKF